jgi:hypothetical protein
VKSAPPHYYGAEPRRRDTAHSCVRTSPESSTGRQRHQLLRTLFGTAPHVQRPDRLRALSVHALLAQTVAQLVTGRLGKGDIQLAVCTCHSM